MTLWNAAAESTFGWTAAEAVGERPRFVPEGAADEFRDHLERARDGDSLDGIEVDRRTKSGDVRQFSVSTAPIRDTDGTVDGVMAVLVDVTERRRRERDLRRYKRLMENLPVGIFRTDPEADGAFSEANPTLLSMFGADSLDDFEGRSITEFYVDEVDRQRVLDQFETGETASVETEFRRLDGEVFWARAIGLRHVDADGSVVVDGILEDLTDTKERDRQFEVIDRTLRHNFRNVLGVILGHADMLLYDDCDDRAVTESAERIRASADRLLELSEKQRVIVKLLSGEIRPTPHDLSASVARQTATIRDRFPNATVEVEFPSDCTVSAVPQVEAALGELLENGIVHDDETPTVRVTGERTADAVVVRVVDTGPGIPFGELAEFRLDRPIDPLTHGTGLNLWLVYWAVTASDGTIRFEENAPRGTAVTIELPRA